MMQDKHVELVEAVNLSATEEEHRERSEYLRAWRDGVEAAGGRIDLLGADNHYLDQGIDRPMCCGVWLDWTPRGRESFFRVSCVPEDAAGPGMRLTVREGGR